MLRCNEGMASDVLRRCGRVAAVAALAACGSSPPPPPAPDAAIPSRVATGRRLVDHAAIVGGLTSDRYVVYSDVNADGHSVAKAMSLDGGLEAVIATSSGTGKSDLRFEIRGRVVFVWSDRGNRMSTLTVWSAATGPIPRGSGVRPGRAAASADGTAIAYEKDITTTTASLVAGPLAGPDTVISTANAEDATCWRDTDLASLGARLLVRYCPVGATAFTLRGLAPGGAMTDLTLDAADARFGVDRIVWRETGGALAATTDGAAVTRLATGASAFTATRDLAAAAFLTSDGAIQAVPTDGSQAARVLVPAGEARQLGALSPDGQTVLYATQIEDRGPGHVAPYTDVRASMPSGAPRTLAPGTTSCPGCLSDPFTPDGRIALVIDPIDNTPALDGAGTIRVLALADGAEVASFGSTIYNAYAIAGTGAGAESRFVFAEAVKDESLVTGWIYGLTARALGSKAEATTLAAGAEDFVIDRASATAVVSFNGDDDISGIWITPLR